VPRFAVLRHETPPGYRQGPHWDLLLEHEGTLLTWALNQWPPVHTPITATKLPDHRLTYLTYEGPVPGDRGHVTRVDEGEYHWLTRSEEPSCQLRLHGLHGPLVLDLQRIEADEQQYTVQVQSR
jgi:hypothetical protein